MANGREQRHGEQPSKPAERSYEGSGRVRYLPAEGGGLGAALPLVPTPAVRRSPEGEGEEEAGSSRDRQFVLRLPLRLRFRGGMLL